VAEQAANNPTMHRFYVPLAAEVGQAIELPETVAKQCHRVLRLNAGEKVALFDGSGQESILILTSVTPRSAAGVVESISFPAVEPSTPLEIVVSMPRQEKWEWILQKCTEIGVSGFQPIQTARSVAQFSDRDWPAKEQRWIRIATEAAEQCGRTRIPTIHHPLTLRVLLGQGNPGIALHTGGAYPGLAALGQHAPLPCRVLVGPEGGLDEEEIGKIAAAGWRLASMGPRTLRCETAAIAACTILLERRGEMGQESRR